MIFMKKEKNVCFISVLIFFVLPVFCSLLISAGTFNEADLIESNCNFEFEYQENTPLYFGNPSDAQPSPEAFENYLMEKAQYTLSYNSSTFLFPIIFYFTVAAGDKLQEISRRH